MVNVNERGNCNQEILKSLVDFFSKNPQLRFWQGLEILGYGIRNGSYFYEESELTLRNIKKEISRLDK